MCIVLRQGVCLGADIASEVNGKSEGKGHSAGDYGSLRYVVGRG
jgi:hypothetical protein